MFTEISLLTAKCSTFHQAGKKINFHPYYLILFLHMLYRTFSDLIHVACHISGRFMSDTKSFLLEGENKRIYFPPPNFMQGSARRLIKVALQEAAKKREMRYSDLKKIDRGVRRHFHDDITVIVVFLDSNLVSRASSVKCPSISVRGGGINLPHNTLAPYTTQMEAGST